jgi:hypothetical protein
MTRECPQCGEDLEEFGYILACLDCGYMREEGESSPAEDYEDYSDLEDAT